MGLHVINVDTPYRMKAVIECSQFVIVRADNIRTAYPVIVADRSTLGRATTATLLRWQTEQQEKGNLL